MKPKVLVAVALLTCLMAAALPGVAGGGAGASPEKAAGEGGPDPRVIVYYFHGTRRCKTCLNIEEQAEKTVKGDFADELASGRVVWRAVDFERKENEHFVDDFELPSSSLVLVEMDGEKTVRHQVLQEVWFLVHDEKKFAAYVREALREFLG
jgi:hypothetical protein